PHPNRISCGPSSDRELELEQVNQALRDELSNEVSINRSNEKYINELERKYTRCEKEIQSLNEELERLENASDEERAELRSENSSLCIQIYNAKKEIRDKVSHIANIERQFQELEERVQNLRYRIKVISSRRSSPSLYNSEKEDTDMAHLDPFTNITRGVNSTRKLFQRTWYTIKQSCQYCPRIDRDLDNIANQRDAQDAQIVQLQQDINGYRQRNGDLQNQVNQLTQEQDTFQAQVAQQQQNLGLLNQQNIVFQRQIEEIEKYRNFWKLNAIYIKTPKDRRISSLLHQQFALQLLNKRSNQQLERQLRQCHNDRVFLQFCRLSAYLAGIDINPVGGARDRAFGILRGYLSGSALDWFDRKILGKRWELHNILANHGQANIAGIQGRTMAQMNTSNSFRNPSIAHTYANVPANNAVMIGNSMIPAESFNEDWRLAGGRPSDRPANAVNAGNNNAIILDNIRIGQALYWLKNEYPTVLSEKRSLVFGSLVQGDDPLGTFYAKLRKYGNMLNHDEKQIKGQFLRGLSSDLEDDADRIGTEQPLEDLFTTLERIETRRLEKRLGLTSKISQSKYKSSPSKGSKNIYSGDTGLTEADVERIVKAQMTSIQPTSPHLQSSSQQISQPDLQAITKSIQDTLARAVKTLENKKTSYKQKSDNAKKVEDIIIKRFLDEMHKQNPDIDPIKKESKPRKTKQKDTSTSGKSRNKLTRVEQSLQKIVLDMLEKALPAHWLEKLKSEIENPSKPFRGDPMSHISPSTKKSDYNDYREPSPEIELFPQ
ncbi:15084_t:CDS:2, partial [Dentiscutata heterogama]